MEPPVGGIVVLGLTGRAQHEPCHCRRGAIVRNVRGDAQARPAMRAGGEGVTEPPLTGVEDLRGAVGANARVGRDLRANGFAGTLDDLKTRWWIGRETPALDPLNPGERRWFLPQPDKQTLDRRLVAPGADQHTLAVVHYFAGQLEFARQPPNGGTKADPLHAASHTDFHPGGRRIGDDRGHAASHSSTRLLPESAMTAVSPRVAMPYGQHNPSRPDRCQRFSPFSRKSR